MQLLALPRALLSSFLSSRELRLLAALVALLFLIRASALETYDLMDPTEARYASVAGEMALRGDWVTPRLPMPTGVEPYLGKPPLHFWLTAMSYLAFGVDEWSARLPSFLCALMVALLLVVFAQRFLSKEVGLVGCALMLSCPVFFFFSGASIVDMTLSWGVSLAFVSYARGLGAEGRARVGWGCACAVGAALGFLTKGPVALCLLGVGIGIFVWLQRDLSSLKRFPWGYAALAFLVLVIPWFAWSEIRNPGFLKYFFWNENIARYLFKEYGDLYGSGHRYVRGFAWIMLFLALLPWTPLLLFTLWRARGSCLPLARSGARGNLSEGRAFLLAWGLSSVVFFSFVRQLHIGYVIPSVAPFALLLADVVSGDSRSEFFRSEKWMVLVRRITLGALLLAAGAVAWDLGHVCGGHPFHIPPIFMIVLVLLGLGLLLKQKPSWSTTPSMSLGVLATALCALYLSAMLVATPYMNRSGSTETIIKVMLANIPGDEVEIGVITRNTFSHYWVALAAERELSKPLKITFLDQSDVGALKDVLVKRKDFEKLPAGVLKDYHERFSYGPWVWLHKGSQGVSEPALNVESSS